MNAILYSSLLPLWEGFDETFHYAYVEHLSTHQAFPVLGCTPVSEEVWQSLQSQPVSHYIQASTKAPISFTDYFALPKEQRSAMRVRLESISRDAKNVPHQGLDNYESNQAPIAYLFLALPDRLLSGFPITSRVLCLRLLISVTSVLLIYFGMVLVGRQLQVPATYATAAIFCVYSSQMLYGAIAHICNDSLAVPAMIFFIWSAIRALERPSMKTFAILAAMLSLGLLIKAYFLFEVPFALVIVARAVWSRAVTWRPVLVFVALFFVLAAPWHIRNLFLYRSLGGTGEKTAGFEFEQALQSFIHLPWIESINYMATSSLWTGNNSFTTFSAKTLYVALFLLVASAVLYVAQRKKVRTSEVAVLASIGLFCMGLIYITLAFFWGTKGAAIAAVPWYMQALLPPIMLLAFLGMSRSGAMGRYTSIAMLILWSYLISATYLIKLIPQYGGFNHGRAHRSGLLSWSLHQSTERDAIMTTMLLTPPWWIYLLTCLVVALCLYLCVRLIIEAKDRMAEGARCVPRTRDRDAPRR